MPSSLMPFDDALAYLLDRAAPVSETEDVPLEAALGRVLAQAVHSRTDLPPMDNAAMDGYALRASDCALAGTELPVTQRIPAGASAAALPEGEAARIFTGAPVPPGADTVVMQEACDAIGETRVRINVPVRSGDCVRRRGEDVREGEQVLAPGVRLDAAHIALAAAVGVPALKVYRPLRVSVLATGNELVMPGEPLPPGRIYNSNRFLLASYLRQLGCDVRVTADVADTLEATRDALRGAADGADLVLSTGGVSVGEEDHVRAAVEAEGELALWKIAMKPGKPLAFGRVGQAAFIGLPGNPVSAFVTLVMLARPWVLKRQGRAQTVPESLPMRAAFDWSRPDRRREFLRARMLPDGSVTLFGNQRPAAFQSIAWANGLVDVPPLCVIQKGDLVRFIPFSDVMC